MRILQLTGMTSTHYGAKENYFVEFSRACQQKGAQCVLQFEDLPRSQEYLEDLKNAGVKVVTLNTGANFLMTILKIARLIYTLRPEIIETHFVNRMIRILVPVVARSLGTRKCVAFVRNMPRRRKLFFRQCFNQYDLVFTVSRAVADYITRIGVRHEIVHPHYWGLLGERENSLKLRSRFRKELGIPGDAVVISIIAFDTPFKGLDVLLDAFSRITKNYPEAHLLVIGVEPEKSNLPEMAVTLGVGIDKIHWAGIRDEGWKLLNAADIYTQPSIDSEGLPNAVVEAMAMKLPTVGTRVSGIPEAIIDGKTGILVEPGNAERLADAFENLFKNPSLWKTQGDAGYKRYLDMFDGKVSINKLIGHYF